MKKETTKPKSTDIVKDDKMLRKVLLERLGELTAVPGGFRIRQHNEPPLTEKQIVDDARKRNCMLSSTSLNRFINYGNIVNGLKQEHILWLCGRYGIDVELKVGTATIVEKDGKYKLKYGVLPYDEKTALKKLNDKFPK